MRPSPAPLRAARSRKVVPLTSQSPAPEGASLLVMTGPATDTGPLGSDAAMDTWTGTILLLGGHRTFGDKVSVPAGAVLSMRTTKVCAAPSLLATSDAR